MYFITSMYINIYIHTTEECISAVSCTHLLLSEDSDNLLFQIAAKRVIDEIDRFPVSLLGGHGAHGSGDRYETPP